jgi:hypothetical protein
MDIGRATSGAIEWWPVPRVPPLGRRLPRPGLRASVLFLSAGLVVVAAVLVSSTVSDHLATTATDATVRTTSAVVHGYFDPLVMSGVAVSQYGVACTKISKP